MSKSEADKKGLEIIKGEDIAPAAALTVPPEWQYNPGKTSWKPDVKNYTGWEREKVEEVIQKANKLREKEEDRVLSELPRVNEVVIPMSKLVDYSLDEENAPDKARVFREALGYTKENAEDLIENIKRNLSHFQASKRNDGGYGKRYTVTMVLKGPNGKTAKVLTGWIDDNKTGDMRLTTLYIDS